MNNKWNSVNIFKRNFDVRYEYLTQQIKQIMNETLEEELIKTTKNNICFKIKHFGLSFPNISFTHLAQFLAENVTTS